MCIYYIVCACVVVRVLYTVHMCGVLLLYVCMCITVWLCIYACRLTLSLIVCTYRLSSPCIYSVQYVLSKQTILFFLSGYLCILILYMRHAIKYLSVLSFCMHGLR